MRVGHSKHEVWTVETGLTVNEHTFLGVFGDDAKQRSVHAHPRGRVLELGAG